MISPPPPITPPMMAPSAFNKFAHGSRKLPCSTLSGVECLSPPPRAKHGKKPQPRHGTSGTRKRHPHRAGIATLHGPDRRRNRDRKAQLIGPGSRQESAAKERTHPSPRTQRMTFRFLNPTPKAACSSCGPKTSAVLHQLQISAKGSTGRAGDEQEKLHPVGIRILARSDRVHA
jgi:hypothetical protein